MLFYGRRKRRKLAENAPDIKEMDRVG